MKYTSQNLDFVTYKNGRGISGVVEYYYASTSDIETDTNPPSDLSKWSKLPNGTSGDNTTFGETYQYLWNREQIEYDNGDKEEATSPAVIAVWSKDGKGIKSITEWYQLNNTESSAPTKPTTNVLTESSWTNLGWNKTIQVPTQLNRFLWNCEVIEYTEGDPEVIGPACIGVHGEKGRSILTTTINHAKTSSLVDPSSIPEYSESNPHGWAARIPQVGENEYLWTRTVIDYDDESPDTVSYSYMYQGKTVKGDSITVKEIRYQAGTSATVAPTGTWYEYNKMPTVPQGSYLWTRTTFSDNTIAYSISYQSIDGDPARDFNITAETYAFIKNKNGTYKNSSILLTAHPINLGLQDNSLITWFKGSSALVDGLTYEATETGVYVAKVTINGVKYQDQVELIEVEEGKDAISITLSNPTMTFHANTSGEGETCEVIVYEGSNKLSATQASRPYFSVSAKSGNPEGTSVNNGIITIGDQTTNGSATFTVTVYPSIGNSTTQDLTVNWIVVSNGNDSTVPGPSTTSNVIYAYYKTASENVEAPEANTKPYDTKVEEDWTIVNQDGTREKPYIFRAEVTETQISNSGIVNQTNYSWSTPILYKAWNNVDQSQTSYADYCRLTSFGNLANYHYEDGKLIINATTLSVTGKFYASQDAGQVQICGWNIDNNRLTSGTQGNNDYMTLGTTSFNAGQDKLIGGIKDTTKKWKLAIGKNFGVTEDGILYASGAQISGTINAGNGGTIGNWNISNGGLTYGTIGAASSVFLSPNGIKSSTAICGEKDKSWAFTSYNTFGITTDGGMYCTSGKIGGWEITTSGLTSSIKGLKREKSTEMKQIDANIYNIGEVDNWIGMTITNTITSNILFNFQNNIAEPSSIKISKMRMVTELGKTLETTDANILNSFSTSWSDYENNSITIDVILNERKFDQAVNSNEDLYNFFKNFDEGAQGAITISLQISILTHSGINSALNITIDGKGEFQKIITTTLSPQNSTDNILSSDWQVMGESLKYWIDKIANLESRIAKLEHNL